MNDIRFWPYDKPQRSPHMQVVAARLKPFGLGAALIFGSVTVAYARPAAALNQSAKKVAPASSAEKHFLLNGRSYSFVQQSDGSSGFRLDNTAGAPPSEAGPVIMGGKFFASPESIQEIFIRNPGPGAVDVEYSERQINPFVTSHQSIIILDKAGTSAVVDRDGLSTFSGQDRFMNNGVDTVAIKAVASRDLAQAEIAIDQMLHPRPLHKKVGLFGAILKKTASIIRHTAELPVAAPYNSFRLVRSFSAIRRAKNAPLEIPQSVTRQSSDLTLLVSIMPPPPALLPATIQPSIAAPGFTALIDDPANDGRTWRLPNLDRQGARSRTARRSRARPPAMALAGMHGPETPAVPRQPLALGAGSIAAIQPAAQTDLDVPRPTSPPRGLREVEWLLATGATTLVAAVGGIGVKTAIIVASHRRFAKFSSPPPVPPSGGRPPLRTGPFLLPPPAAKQESLRIKKYLPALSSMLVGGATGAVVKMGLNWGIKKIGMTVAAKFALAALAATVPAAAVPIAAFAGAIVLSAGVAAVAGGISQVVTTKLFGGDKKLEAGWKWKAFRRGALTGGLVGGFAAGVVDIFQAHGFLHGLINGHQDANAPHGAPAPTVAHPAAHAIPAMHDAVALPRELLSAEQIKELPEALQKLGQSQNPADMATFCDKASSFLSQQHNPSALKAAVALMRRGLELAPQNQHLQANLAYMEFWGKGTARNAADALSHAKLAGHAAHHYGERLLHYARTFRGPRPTPV